MPSFAFSPSENIVGRLCCVRTGKSLDFFFLCVLGTNWPNSKKTAAIVSKSTVCDSMWRFKEGVGKWRSDTVTWWAQITHSNPVAPCWNTDNMTLLPIDRGEVRGLNQLQRDRNLCWRAGFHSGTLIIKANRLIMLPPLVFCFSIQEQSSIWPVRGSSSAWCWKVNTHSLPLLSSPGRRAESWGGRGEGLLSDPLSWEDFTLLLHTEGVRQRGGLQLQLRKKENPTQAQLCEWDRDQRFKGWSLLLGLKSIKSVPVFLSQHSDAPRES